jgi:hypothetical protein
MARPRLGAEVNPFRTVLLFLLLVPLHAAAQEIGTLTFLEGSLRVVRGASAHPGKEGLRLRQGDILESSEGGFAQLEFRGGAIVALGPSSRLYIFRYAAGGSKSTGTSLILLSGWLKAEANSAVGMWRYDSPLLSGFTANGTLLFHTTREGCNIYVESGSAMVGEVSREGISHQLQPGKAGLFFLRQVGKKVAVFPRPSAEFVDSMPRAFKDTLPPRIDKFSKPVPLPAGKAVTFSDVQPWLTMPATWRRGLVTRFQPRLNDPEFRNQVEAHLAQLPEWDPILHPEKYQPAPPPTPVHNSDSPQVRN